MALRTAFNIGRSVRPASLALAFRATASSQFRSVAWSRTCTRSFSWLSKEEGGVPETLEHRLFFYKKGEEANPISPWHDIPLMADKDKTLFNYINEIPKGTRAKMEIATKEPSTPIKQDIKKGALRFFGYGDIPFNYGCLPQTWEDPSVPHPATSYPGDNDPVDVVEIGEQPLAIGSVVSVKVVGCLALIDEDETDWKVIAIRQDHALFDKIHDIQDVDAHIPGCISSIREWFKMYKTADGKPENKFAFDGEAKDKEFTLSVVEETSQSWKDLRAGKIENKKGLSLA